MERANIIAEDLGFMTDEIIAWENWFPRNEDFAVCVIQMMKASIAHMAPHNSVMYLGTHDNNTVLGWYKDEIDDQHG